MLISTTVCSSVAVSWWKGSSQRQDIIRFNKRAKSALLTTSKQIKYKILSTFHQNNEYFKTHGTIHVPFPNAAREEPFVEDQARPREKRGFELDYAVDSDPDPSSGGTGFQPWLQNKEHKKSILRQRSEKKNGFAPEELESFSVCYSSFMFELITIYH